MGTVAFFDNYSPAGDILVMAVCLVIFVLLSSSYVIKTKIYGVYLGIVFCVFGAATADLACHAARTYSGNGSHVPAYVLLILYHFLLYLNLFLFVVYVTEVMRLERGKKRVILLIGMGIFISVTCADVANVFGGGTYEVSSSKIISNNNIFMAGYLAFVTLILVVMSAFRKRIYRRVMMGFYGTMLISFGILFLQSRYDNTSFTVGSFLFPAIAMLYLIHANPYDIEIGSINAKALEDTVSNNYKKGREMILMSLFLPDFEVDGRAFSKELQDTIRRFANEYFKEGLLFQVSNGHIILIARKNKNRDYKQKMKAMIDAFYPEYGKFRYDYKIVMGEGIDEISRKNEYVQFIKSIHQNMKMNDVHVIRDKDVEDFEEYDRLLNEMSDICKKGDLRDKRVLVYCQPVLNLKTGKYDTAEALMRLEVAGRGIIYPDKFISIAEENGYVHGLTKIILQKTCDEVGKLLQEGYEVKRISVNVAISEMHDLSFTDDFLSIIRGSRVPDEKIAIEITESQTEQDFVVVKNKIRELQDRGIKFYLDDFGTGYSNMERILELPFDIIKFDRSLVTATEDSNRSEKMVGSLANMFAELNYSVLYEGVETEGDEERCTKMGAFYLQGYKYSRPIPISELRRFFSKRTAN